MTTILIIGMINIGRIDNAVPNAHTCHSLELDIIRCIDDILEQVHRSTGLSLTDAQAERVLAGKPCSMDEKAREIVLTQGRRYVNKLLSAILEAGFDCKALPVIFMGGGAKIVKRSLVPTNTLCRLIYLTDARVNAVGFERLVRQVVGK